MAAWVLFLFHRRPRKPGRVNPTPADRPQAHGKDLSFPCAFYIYITIIPVLRRNITMEQFELRFIVCGNDLAATRECAKFCLRRLYPESDAVPGWEISFRHRDHRIRRRRIARLAGGIDLRSAHGDPVSGAGGIRAQQTRSAVLHLRGHGNQPRQASWARWPRRWAPSCCSKASGRRSRSTNSARETRPLPGAGRMP